MNYKNGIILFTIFLTCSTTRAQTADDIANKLINDGYENVIVSSSDSTLYVAVENRVLRFDVDAIIEILQLISSDIKSYNNLSIIMQNKRTPLIQIDVSTKDIAGWIDGDMTTSSFSDKLNVDLNIMETWEQIINHKENYWTNSSNSKFDFVIKPSYKFQFGIYSDPVLYQLNLAPHMEFGFWKGSTFLYELTIPIHNDFGSREDSVRTSFVAFNQTFRFSNTFFLSASVGYFTQNRYGFDLEAKNYFMKGNMSLGFNLGYTGYASFSGTKLFYSDLYLWTGSMYLDYRIPEYDLTLGVMIGKYLMSDNTFRVDINREFGEIQIGFFALRSMKGVSNGGINISIPLFPSKYWKPGLVRFRTTQNLSYSYLVKTDLDDLIGLRYNSGFRLNEFTKRLNPDFVRNYIKNRIK